MQEQTVVLVKPDGVKRALVGRIVGRFEESGLKIKALKMVWVTKDLVAQHYTDKEEFLAGMGKKTLETYEKYGKDPREELGTKDAVEIGKMIRQWNIEFMSSGPLVAILLEGIHAVDTVRKIVGSTLPHSADPGTIRGMFSVDSPALANQKKRAVKNLVHASGNPVEAEFERQLWFKESEIFDYQRADESVMYD